MPNATVASNRERIIVVEDEVGALDERVTTIEKMYLEHIAKVDLIIQMGKVILAVVAASFGLDLSIEGGIL